MQTKVIHREVQEIVDGRNNGIRCILVSFMVLSWSFVAWRVDSTNIGNLFGSNVIPLTFYFAVGCVATCQMNPLIGPKLLGRYCYLCWV